MKLAAKVLSLLAIATLHVLAIFYLYRGRHIGWPFCDSDAVVFFLPSAVAFAADLAVAFWIGRSAGWAIPIAFAAALVSFWMAMTVAINTFGS